MLYYIGKPNLYLNLLRDDELPVAQALFLSEVWGIFKLTEESKKTRVGLF